MQPNHDPQIESETKATAPTHPHEPGRRLFLGTAAAGLSGSLMAVSNSATGAEQTQSGTTSPTRSSNSKANIQALFPPGAPAAAPGYSPGIVASGGRVVFVSGQGPEDLTADMETQLRQTMDRIGIVLKAAGATFKDVVMIRAYFVHIKRDLPIYRKVRLDYLSEPFPAATAVATPELAIDGLEIEIEAVAIVGS